MTQSVLAKLVTGEMAVGSYSGHVNSSGSHLIENLRTDNGFRADFGWADTIEKCECEGEFVCNRCWKYNEIATA